MPLCDVFARAATINYHTLSVLNDKYLFLTVLEVGKSKSKMPADPVSNEGPLSGVQMAIFSMYPYMEERGERK